ncbi:MAG: UDP-N-acetylmuramoyl-L-alanine--D-glutamate ligase [Chloroflexi bacterium B3_Chlor]|nr:MAG: UDP-N-acetylmuramoyl-L-alanine--D-glutamate ligase [Chloroflexi bacterium B3_Chlor]
MAYENQKVMIVGLGREGIALAKFLAGQGANVTITDMKSEEALRDKTDQLAGLPIHYLLGGHPEESLDADVIFVSPGVPREIPILVEAQQRGVALSSETKLFFSLCRAPIIGITGSSGKTTTTSLVGDIMRAGGYRTFVGGNIGSPLISVVDEIEPQDKVVMELSSFQLEALDQSPHIAAILNLSPNHLDRHQSIDDYVSAKVNIIRFQKEDDYAILNADDPLAQQIAKHCRGRTLLFSPQQEVETGAFLDQGQVTVRWEDEEWKVCHVSEVQLLGSHNLENVLAACAIAVPAGAQSEAMRTAVTSFSGVEHRLELVAEIEGVRYYDDSIATSPQRAMAALNSFSEPIVLLAGGRGKHLPLEGLAQLIVKKVKALILFGEAASLLEQAVMEIQGDRRELPIYRSADLSEAVRTAGQIVRAGDVVLLAPACTSFDMYRDFAERGEHFKSLVRDLKKSQQ